MSRPSTHDEDFVYESGDDTDTWDLQPEEYWRGDDESDLDESESEEEADDSLDAHIDPFKREEESHSHDDSEYVMGDVEEYVYEPLEHPEGRTTILSIHLRPSSNLDSPLVCTLSTTSIGHDGGELPRAYEALSYTWGSTDLLELLFVIPSHPPKRAPSFMVAIMRNLHDALKHLRRRDRELVIWVDAVCIHQSNTEEKDRQVGVMSKIYRYAMVTHAWLGLDSVERDGEICLGWIEAIASKVKDNDIGGMAGDTLWNALISDVIPSWGDPHPRLLLKLFFDRGYFQRRWTIQERYYAGLGVGLDVHCGKTTTLWRPYEHGKALRRLETWVLEQGYDQQTIKQIAAAIPMAANSLTAGYDTVLSFMERYANAECSDPRDRVLSLLDVITDEYHFPLLPARVGYGASINTVYTAFARALYSNAAHALSIRSEPSSGRHTDDFGSRLEVQQIVVDIMDRAGSMKSGFDACEPRLPSWVIDWRQKPSYDTSFALQTYPGELYREYMQPFIFGHGGLHGLCCNARLFDEVHQVFPDSLSMISVVKQIAYTASMCNLTGLLADAYRRPHATEELDIGQEQIDSVFTSWRWCFIDVPVAEVSTMAEYSSEDGMVTVMNAVANAFVLSSHQNYIESTQAFFGPWINSRLYAQKKREALRGRTLYITKRGFIGVGPEGTKEGDQIWTLTESNNPFILRPAVTPELGELEARGWKGHGFKGNPSTTNLIGSAHLVPPSAGDIISILHDLELRELCII